MSHQRGFRQCTLDFDLSEIQPDFERLKTFSKGGISNGFSYLVLVAIVVYLVLQLTPVPPIAVAVVGAVVSLPGFGIIVVCLRPFDVALFRTRNGSVAFDIIRDSKQAADFDEYVECIRADILQAGRLKCTAASFSQHQRADADPPL